MFDQLSPVGAQIVPSWIKVPKFNNTPTTTTTTTEQIVNPAVHCVKKYLKNVRKVTIFIEKI
jgi:hypothetical protein